MTFEEDLSVTVRARNPLIWITSPEEDRATSAISDVIRKQSVKGAGDLRIPKRVYFWSSTKGLYFTPQQGDPEYSGAGSSVQYVPLDILEIFDHYYNERKDQAGSHIPSALVMYDIHAVFPDQKQVIRRIKESYRELQTTFKTIIFVSPVCNLPQELHNYVRVIDLPYPTTEELSAIVGAALTTSKKFREISGNNVRSAEEIKQEIANAARGLTGMELNSILNKAISRGSFSLNDIITAKKEIIEKSGVLEYFPAENFSLSDIGGLENLRTRIRSLPRRFSPEAKKYGLDLPKGIILIGPPGTGKSLSAKVIAGILRVPLVKMSMSQIASKWYGESTQNMRNALNLLKALSPCVCLIDELEKTLSSGTSGDTHEETNRMIGEFLTFMEECKDPIFWVGTCNDKTGIKPELMQRFELMVFCDLPNRTERREIFSIHLGKKRDLSGFDLDVIAGATGGFVGREITVIIKEAMSAAFMDNREVNTEDILKIAGSMVPTSVQREPEINALRNWARNNCLFASIPDQTEKTGTGAPVIVSAGEEFIEE